MKANLEFNLPDDDYAFKLAVAADQLATALSEIDNTARSVLKHGDDKVEQLIQALEAIRDLVPREYI